MTTRITDRDWELLSAYLDGELNARDKARLEGRLQASTDLHAALNDLRRTRALLRAQPRLRAPRNFTLTAESAGIRSSSRPAPRLSPIFGMVSAFASFLLVAVVLSELVVKSPTMSARQISAAPTTYSEVQNVETLAVEAAAGAAEAPAVEEGAQAPPAPQQLPADAQKSVQTEAPMDLAMKTAPLEAAPGAGSAYPYPAPEMLIQQSAAMTGTLMQTEAVVAEATPIAAAQPADIDQSANQAAVETGSQAQPVQKQTFWNAWRLAELLLLILVVAAATAALRLRRAGN